MKQKPLPKIIDSMFRKTKRNNDQRIKNAIRDMNKEPKNKGQFPILSPLSYRSLGWSPSMYTPLYLNHRIDCLYYDLVSDTMMKTENLFSDRANYKQDSYKEYSYK